MCIYTLSDYSLASFRSGIEENVSEVDILLGDLSEWDKDVAEKALTDSQVKATKVSLIQEGKLMRKAAKVALSPGEMADPSAFKQVLHA